MKSMSLDNRGLAIWATIAALLLAPLVAMQFTPEVAWTGFDFAAAALLLGGGGLAWEFASRKVERRALRLPIAVGIVLVVAVIWADGAVGIF